MVWTPPERNYSGIQHEEFRRTFDPAFDTLHDALSDAYYNFWSNTKRSPLNPFGNPKSKPFQGYDVQPTRAESKALFDKLHGLIYHHYAVEFHAENLKQPEPKRIPEEEYNVVRSRDGSLKSTKADTAQAGIDALDAEGVRITL